MQQTYSRMQFVEVLWVPTKILLSVDMLEQKPQSLLADIVSKMHFPFDDN